MDRDDTLALKNLTYPYSGGSRISSLRKCVGSIERMSSFLPKIIPTIDKRFQICELLGL